MSSFTRALTLRDLENGKHFAVIDQFRYYFGTIDSGYFFDVFSGFITDLASIPILRALTKGNIAAVLHDYLYQYPYKQCYNPTGPRSHISIRLTRKECDIEFRIALLAKGESKAKAWRWYAGVRLVGWRPWNKYRKTDKVRNKHRAMARQVRRIQRKNLKPFSQLMNDLKKESK